MDKEVPTISSIDSKEPTVLYPTDTKQESFEISSTDAEELTDLMIDFLCLKYTLSGVNLARKLQEKEGDLKKKLVPNWSKIRHILNYKAHPNVSCYTPVKPDHGITIILPKNDLNPDKTWEFFMGAAYFPFQLDPQAEKEWRRDKDMIIQLAFATYYRYFAARNKLVWLDAFYPEIKGHRLCRYKTIPAINEDETYYELQIPAKYHGQDITGRNTLNFDWKNDKEKAIEFFDQILEIARNGPSITLNEDL